MYEFYKELKQFGHVKLNESLSKHSTFKIGGPADFFIEVCQTAKLIELLNFLSSEGIDYRILGGGSNMLFPDDGFRGVIVRVKTVECRLMTADTIVADSGVLLAQVVSLALQNNLSGLEWAVGIPGTVGGAARGNAGAMGRASANGIQKVEVWREREIIELNADECGFEYRESIFKHNNDVVLRAWYKLIPGEKQKIMSQMQEYLKHRNGRYPKEPNAGSFFKNIKLEKWPGNKEELPDLFKERGTVPIGWLVEQVGMKGFKVGGAMISNEHGNFIVNSSNATQQDILTIVDELKQKVYNKFTVDIEEEVEIVL